MKPRRHGIDSVDVVVEERLKNYNFLGLESNDRGLITLVGLGPKLIDVDRFSPGLSLTAAALMILGLTNVGLKMKLGPDQT